MGKGEKDSFYYFARQRGPEQANALKTVPPTGKNCRELYSEKENKTKQNRFQLGSRIGANIHSPLFGGISVVKAGVRSWPDTVEAFRVPAE